MERSPAEDALPKGGVGVREWRRPATRSCFLPLEAHAQRQWPFILSITVCCALCKACPCHVVVVLNSCLCGNEEGR